MINLDQLMTGLVAGSVVILFGLFPRLFQGLAEGVREGVCNFSESLRSPFLAQPRGHGQIRTPRWWLAGLGLALVAASVLAYRV